MESKEKNILLFSVLIHLITSEFPLSIRQRIIDHFLNPSPKKLEGPSWNNKNNVLLCRESLVKAVNRVVLRLIVFMVSENFHQYAFLGATCELVRDIGPTLQHALHWIPKIEFLNLFTNINTITIR